MDILISNNRGDPVYDAYITFSDGTTSNITLPSITQFQAPEFWGIASPQGISSIAFGGLDGAVTQAGALAIANLTIAATPVPEPGEWPLLFLGVAVLFAARRRKALAGVAVALSLSGAANAALLLRDINGTPTTDSARAVFAYDTVLKVTWDLTANNGGLDWVGANNWVRRLKLGIGGKFGGWMLPTALNMDGTGPCIGYNCAGSEMGELYYTELGNVAHPNTGFYPPATGPFKNLQPGDYWSSTQDATIPSLALVFYTSTGYQDSYFKNTVLFSLAVRPGDVAPQAVPEPGEWVLVGLGLGAIALARRRS